jgi:hypothetical protein
MSVPKKTARKNPSQYPDYALIREAHGLTPDEKLLLYTIASHHRACFATVATIREWTGLSRNRYYKARKGLVDKELVSADVSLRGGVTTYRLRKRAIRLRAEQAVDARQARRRHAVASPPTLEVGHPMPAMGMTPACDGQDSPAHGRQVTHDRDGHQKTNGKVNKEGIKKMKSRRARPVQVRAPASGVTGETVDEKAERMRRRFTEHSEHRESL